MTALPTEAPAPTGAAIYAVKLEIFEGPLDLLLHLIRQNEVEITDIPIALVAEQYLEYIDLMRELELDVAGEYLLMAATLAWIKSRMLLPVEGEGEEAEGPDPRAELVARLLEYQRFKEAAGELSERPLLGRDVFAARLPELEPVPDAEREIEVDLFALVEAFRRALAAAGPVGRPHEVEIDPITVHERMVGVMDDMDGRESLEFALLIAPEGGAPRSRAFVVATFLAILELARLTLLLLYQNLDEAGGPHGPIRVRRAGERGEGSWAQRIAELV